MMFRVDKVQAQQQPAGGLGGQSRITNFSIYINYNGGFDSNEAIINTLTTGGFESSLYFPR
jgi:hypothetical protein